MNGPERNMESWPERFCPWFQFHENERYFPMTLADYMQQCDVVQAAAPVGVVAYKGPLTSALLDQLCNQQPPWTATPYTFNLALREGTNNPLVQQPPPRPTPMMPVHVVETATHVLIQYLMFYAYNGPSLLMHRLWAGAHEADLESVRARVNRQSGLLEGYYLSHHGDSTFVTVDQLDQVEGRPVIYVAQNSHAHYPLGRHAYRRHYGCCYDYTGQGLRWRPEQLVRWVDPDTPGYDPVTMGHLRWRGYLGRTHVAAFRLHDWWDGSTDRTNVGVLDAADDDPLSDRQLTELKDHPSLWSRYGWK